MPRSIPVPVRGADPGGVGDPEISDLQLAAGAEQQVSQLLDVAVHQACLVGGLQTRSRLGRASWPGRAPAVRRPAPGPATARRPVPSPGRAAQHRHHLVLHVRDTGMRQRPRHAGLRTGTAPRSPDAVHTRLRSSLTATGRASTSVSTSPDLAHAAGRDPALQPVPACEQDAGMGHNSQTLPARRQATGRFAGNRLGGAAAAMIGGGRVVPGQRRGSAGSAGWWRRATRRAP